MRSRETARANCVSSLSSEIPPRKTHIVPAHPLKAIEHRAGIQKQRTDPRPATDLGRDRKLPLQLRQDTRVATGRKRFDTQPDLAPDQSARANFLGTKRISVVAARRAVTARVIALDDGSAGRLIGNP